MCFDQRTFLVVEDSSDDRMLLEHAFRHAEVTNPVVFKEDGSEAQAYLEKAIASPDRWPIPMVMLTDLMMPRMDGFELMSWVKQQPALRHMLVVVLSSSTMEADAIRASEAGAQFYLGKPSRLVDLEKMVRSLTDWLKVVRHIDEPSVEKTSEARTTPVFSKQNF